MSDVSSVPANAPFFRRLSTVVVMTVSLLFMPVAALLIWTGPIFKRRPEGWQPISNKARYIYGSILVVWLIAATVKAFLQPGEIEGEWQGSADASLPAPATQSASVADKPTVGPSLVRDQASTPSRTTDGGLPTCDNPAIIQTAREAIDESPAGVTMGLRVRDVGKGQENLYDPEAKVRRCATRVMLNSGSSIMTYQVLYGPSGNMMVQAQVGERAMAQLQQDEIEAAQMTHKAQMKDQAPTADQVPSEEPTVQETETRER